MTFSEKENQKQEQAGLDLWKIDHQFLKALDLSIILPVIIYINFKTWVLWLPYLDRRKAFFGANIHTEMFDTPFRWHLLLSVLVAFILFVVTSPWVTGGNLRSPLWGIVRGGTPKASCESCGDHLVRPPPTPQTPTQVFCPTQMLPTQRHTDHTVAHTTLPHTKCPSIKRDHISPIRPPSWPNSWS